MDLLNFEERADYLDEQMLIDFTVADPFFNFIHEKLLERGAKLIVGPRGAGKTHQLKYAHFICLRDNSKPLSIYVSFGKYYYLEPLLYNSTNAIRIFHAWVLAKIIYGVYEIMETLNVSLSFKYHELFPKELLDNFIQHAEKFNELPEYNDLLNELSIQKVVTILEDVSFQMNRKRLVLLLDDAALTLSSEYMIEFFDIVRSVKSIHISPKASVYPGTTQYGPRFHLGQDAEEVLAWLNVDSENYSSFMSSVFEKRFPNLEINLEILELLKYSAFGIPRAFLTLIRNFEEDKGKTTQQKFNTVIHNQADLLIKEYQSLSLKSPQYQSILEIGNQFFDTIINQITEANRSETSEKIIHFGILKEPRNLSFDRMIKFLIEAGLLHEGSPLNDGPERVFKRYIPHFLFLIQNRAFTQSKGFNAKEIIEFLNRKISKRPLRRQFSTILTKEQIERVKLDLPPCRNCGAIRLSESQKFCHNCGNPLIGESIYESILKESISSLPIPEWQKTRILKETDFSTIGDILLSQSPAGELKKDIGIGKQRSNKIISAAISYVDEFLA